MKSRLSLMFLLLVLTSLQSFAQYRPPTSHAYPSTCALEPALPPATIDPRADALCRGVSSVSNEPGENLEPQKDPAHYFVIDVPGASEGTYPTDMNSAGEVVGYFVDENIG